MINKQLRGLYAITPEYLDGDKLLADVSLVLAGGCKLLQYRDKQSSPAERVKRARALLQLSHSFGAKLVINDDLPLAVLINADGIHLGKDDGNLASARAIIGPEKILGASCYADYDTAQLGISIPNQAGGTDCYGAPVQNGKNQFNGCKLRHWRHQTRKCSRTDCRWRKSASRHYRLIQRTRHHRPR
jgi:thiamine-phosphate diphosphorylase